MPKVEGCHLILSNNAAIAEQDLNFILRKKFCIPVHAGGCSRSVVCGFSAHALGDQTHSFLINIKFGLGLLRNTACAVRVHS